MCFRKKDKNELFKEDKIIIEGIVTAFKIVMLQLEGNEICDKVVELHKKFSYISPKGNKATIKTDNKIKDKADDMKLAVSKALKKEDFSEINDLISEIKILAEVR